MEDGQFCLVQVRPHPPTSDSTPDLAASDPPYSHPSMTAVDRRTRLLSDNLTITLETAYPSRHPGGPSWVMLGTGSQWSRKPRVTIQQHQPAAISASTLLPTKSSCPLKAFANSSLALDHTAYPHLLQSVINILYASAKHRTILTLRLASRGTRDAVDRLLSSHVRFTVTDSLSSSSLVASTPLGRFPRSPSVDLEHWVGMYLSQTCVLDLDGTWPAFVPECHTNMPKGRMVRWIDGHTVAPPMRLNETVEAVIFLRRPDLADAIHAAHPGARRRARCDLLPPMAAMHRAQGVANITVHFPLTAYGQRYWRASDWSYSNVACAGLRSVTIILDPRPMPVGLEDLAQFTAQLNPNAQDLLGGIVADIAQTAHTVRWTLVSLEDVRRRKFDPAQKSPAGDVCARIVQEAKMWRQHSRYVMLQETAGAETASGGSWADGWSEMTDDEIERCVAQNMSFLTGKEFRAKVGEELFSLYTDSKAGWGQKEAWGRHSEPEAAQW